MIDEATGTPILRMQRDTFDGTLYINSLDLIEWLEADIDVCVMEDIEMTPLEVFEDQLMRLRIAIANRGGFE